MPLFDFACRACGHQVELLVKADVVPECPDCGAAGMVKLVSAPAAPGTSKAKLAAARGQARREGHFSNY